MRSGYEENYNTHEAPHRMPVSRRTQAMNVYDLRSR